MFPLGNVSYILFKYAWPAFWLATTLQQISPVSESQVFWKDSSGQLQLGISHPVRSRGQVLAQEEQKVWGNKGLAGHLSKQSALGLHGFNQPWMKNILLQKKF